MQKGDQGDKVKRLQNQLNKVLGLRLVADGDYGAKTEKAVRSFQQKFGLHADGIAGMYTTQRLNEEFKRIGKRKKFRIVERKFSTFVDAGHGSMLNGEYVTPGKRAFHPGVKLHDDLGNYYEGYENRIVAEMFIAELAKNGIVAIRTYDAINDTSLATRARTVRNYLRAGYAGYMHSFHSNAISSSNSPAKLEATTGLVVYTTRDDNFSDQIAQHHFDNVKEEFGDEWNYREQTIDMDSDFEANFSVLKNTNLDEFEGDFGAFLEEWGFHTSSKDAKFIIESRKRRVACAVKTALWTKARMGL